MKDRQHSQCCASSITVMTVRNSHIPVKNGYGLIGTVTVTCQIILTRQVLNRVTCSSPDMKEPLQHVIEPSAGWGPWESSVMDNR